MKRKIIGTICACMGLVFASGTTITGGLLAIAFMSVAAIALRSDEAKQSEKSLSDSHVSGKVINLEKVA